LGRESLPFKGFAQNGAYYYLMVVAYNLFEYFKQDLEIDVVSITIYASTFWRKLIDIASKIVHTGGKIIAKVSEAIFNRLKLYDIWDKLLSFQIAVT